MNPLKERLLVVKKPNKQTLTKKKNSPKIN